jgi:hypothetical protein
MPEKRIHRQKGIKEKNSQHKKHRRTRETPKKKAKQIEKEGDYSRRTKIFTENTRKEMRELEEYLKLNKEKLIDEKLFKNDHDYDDKRLQNNVPDILKRLKRKRKEKGKWEGVFNNIRKELINHLKKEHPNYILSKGNVLISLPGGEKQQEHVDFEKNQLIHPPLVFFLAISHCRLDIEEEEGKLKEINLKSGNLLTFHGWTIHRGVSYHKVNIRMHWYGLHQEDCEIMEVTEKGTTLVIETEGEYQEMIERPKKKLKHS